MSYTIKHQRDKQIIFVHRAGIQLFNLSEGYQYSSSLNLFKGLYKLLVSNIIFQESITRANNKVNSKTCKNR